MQCCIKDSGEVQVQNSGGTVVWTSKPPDGTIVPSSSQKLQLLSSGTDAINCIVGKQNLVSSPDGSIVLTASAPPGMLQLLDRGQQVWRADSSGPQDASQPVSACLGKDGRLLYRSRTASQIYWASPAARAGAKGPFTAMVSLGALQVGCVVGPATGPIGQFSESPHLFQLQVHDAACSVVWSTARMGSSIGKSAEPVVARPPPTAASTRGGQVKDQRPLPSSNPSVEKMKAFLEAAPSKVMPRAFKRANETSSTAASSTASLVQAARTGPPRRLATPGVPPGSAKRRAAAKLKPLPQPKAFLTSKASPTAAILPTDFGGGKAASTSPCPYPHAAYAAAPVGSPCGGITLCGTPDQCRCCAQSVCTRVSDFTWLCQPQ
jgi:hypothetical protein